MQNIPLERQRFQRRLSQEISRSTRFDRPFVLVLFEASPSRDGLSFQKKLLLGEKIIRASLRDYDVLAPVYDDVLATLMLETSPAGAQAALHRLRGRLAMHAGNWSIEIYAFPAQAIDIAQLPMLRAA